MNNIYDFKKGDYVTEVNQNHGILAIVLSVDTIHQTVTVKYSYGNGMKTATLHYSRLNKVTNAGIYDIPFNRES